MTLPITPNVMWYQAGMEARDSGLPKDRKQAPAEFAEWWVKGWEYADSVLREPSYGADKGFDSEAAYIIRNPDGIIIES